MNLKQNKFILIIACIFIGAMVSGFAKNPIENAEETFKNYRQAIDSSQYENAYDMLAEQVKMNASKEDFIEQCTIDAQLWAINDSKLSNAKEYNNKELGNTTYKNVIEFTNTITYIDYTRNNTVRTISFPVYVVMDNGQYKIYRKTENIRKSLSKAYNTLGNVYSDGLKKNNIEALSAFKKAIKYDDNDAKLYYNLSKTYYDLNRLDEAKSTIEKGIQCANEDAVKSNCMTLLGVIYAAKNDLEAAKYQFREALKLNPDNEYAKDCLIKLGE